MSRFSIIPARAVYDSRLSPSALKVLCALGVNADRGGWCYPSLKKIGALIGCSRQTVSGHIGTLVSLGYIESRVQKRDDGGQSSNLYRILMDVGDPEAVSDLTGGDGLEPTGGAGPEPTGGDGQLFDTITSHTNDPINDPYRNIPLPGANLEKVNSLQKKDCAKNAHTARRKTRIPDDWEIEEDDPNHLYAKSKGMTWAELEVEEEKFKNFHGAKGSVFADVNKAWRTWVTNWLTYRRGSYGKTQK